MAEISLDHLLTFCVQQGGSDLLLKAGQPPIIRLHGDLVRMKMEPLSPEAVRRLSFAVITDEQIARFERNWELDYAYEILDVARFRCNIMQQRSQVSSVYRVIPYRIQSIEELGLPDICYRLSDYPRGLVLVTGPTGSGKSTTLAAMIDYINSTKPVHIMTVEDPVEFVHEDKQALINQRELGRDTVSFADALKYVLRQDPDVILIGEMRDLETIALAITAAETGHLVFGTLHTTNAVQTVDRVIDVFPPYQQQQIRMQVSVNLVGVLSQVLCKTADHKGRVAAFETMEAIPAIRNQIREGKTHQIGSIIQTGSKRGMTSLDQSLAQLVVDGRADETSARSKTNDIEEYEEILRRSEQS
ncbi:MAG: type IV pilus twitching motility protein PilT [candidate division WS1 bacterium]|jgi:twitching motility protein PilT|nr:type IV pilus twitching motility protein PilT [candidate division WS1 bacterium]